MRTARIFQNSLIVAILFASGPSHASDQLLRLPATGDPALIIVVPDGWNVRPAQEAGLDGAVIASGDECCRTVVSLTQGETGSEPIVDYETKVLKMLGATRIAPSDPIEIAGISTIEQSAVVDRDGKMMSYRVVAFQVDQTHFASILHVRPSHYPIVNDDVFNEALSQVIDRSIKIANSSGPTALSTPKKPAIAEAAQSTSSFGWQYTRWGMTPDEVVRASQGLAEPNTDRKRDPDGATATLMAPYQSGEYSFVAAFSFGNQDHRLIYVDLDLQNPNATQCAYLANQLANTYGASQDHTQTKVLELIKWYDPQHGNAIVYENIGGAHCSIRYMPYGNRNAPGGL